MHLNKNLSKPDQTSLSHLLIFCKIDYTHTECLRCDKEKDIFNIYMYGLHA